MMGPPRPRVKVNTTRITGQIVEWKKTFGWIQPDKPLNHPESRFHRGRIYLGQKDVEEEISGVGANVSFFAYADGTGIGAMNCRPADSPSIQKTIEKPGPGAGPMAAVLEPGRVACMTPSASPPRAASAAAAPASASSTGPLAGTGARLRVGDTPVAGHVTQWSGGFGWIEPLEPIPHPLFNGKVYLSASDVNHPDLVADGTQVFFFVYADAKGLGAQEATVVDLSIEAARPAEAVPTAGGKATATPPVLKATPKAVATAIPTKDPEMAKRLAAWLWDRGG